ncbi:MAG TPA: hypothetical protein VNZ43_06955 [Sphingomonadaceae bacterium]|nr:hypothetical protein [Sphingomonadaceae bacterium]
MSRSTLLLACVALATACPALAGPADEEAPSPPEKVSTLVVYGNDPCPRSTNDEIIVCAREPESERYRIPKRFRGKKRENAPAVESWANTARELDYVSRAGLPNSCSPVGSGGMTGCYNQFLAQAREERRAEQQEQNAYRQ